MHRTAKMDGLHHASVHMHVWANGVVTPWSVQRLHAAWLLFDLMKRGAAEEDRAIRYDICFRVKRFASKEHEMVAWALDDCARWAQCGISWVDLPHGCSPDEWRGIKRRMEGFGWSHKTEQERRMSWVNFGNS